MFLLLADVEWMRWIGLIVFIVIYILNHFLGGDKKKAQAARAKAAGSKPAERAPQAASQNRPAAPSPARRSQSQEIDAFLQRAKDRRREKTSPAKPAAKTPPPRRLVEAPVEAEVVKPRQLGASIANKQIDTRDVTEHAEHLTDDLTQADQMREVHRRKMFSHRVGSLEDTSGEVGAKAGEDAPQSNAAATAAAAVPVAAAFFQPKDIRQAVIVSEVLQRPEHRW